jgi:polyisoprenyl-phosphate glycosyltransferase
MPGREQPLISFVIPVFDEQDVLEELLQRVGTVADSLPGDVEVVLVDDGSSDRSPEIMRSGRERDPRVKVVRLSRNFGHQLAITAGLDFASGDAIVIMDCDLQDPPELVPEMVQLWQQGYDVVSGQRPEREGEGRTKSGLRRVFYRLLRRASDLDIPLDAGDFRLVDRRVADIVRNMREPGRFLREMFTWVGFKQTGIDYVRPARESGESKYTLGRLGALARDGVLATSGVPLRIALWLGFAVSILAFAAAVGAFVAKFFVGSWPPGWASLAVILSFFSGVQLMILGVVGEYVGRIYEQGRHRPLYLVSEVDGFAEDLRTPEVSRATPPARA